MKEEKNAQLLQWLVDFANLDLERIGAGDKAKLLVESDYLWPSEELNAYDRLGPHAPLPKQFSWALKIPAKESPQYWSAIVAAQKFVRDLFASTHIQVTAHPSSEVAGAPSLAIVLRGRDDFLWWMGKGPGFPYTLKFLPVTQSQSDYLRLKILSLLVGFNQHAIKRCLGCNRWFFNPTNRAKRFCSNRCIWRTNTAKRRKVQKQKGKAGAGNERKTESEPGAKGESLSVGQPAGFSFTATAGRSVSPLERTTRRRLRRFFEAKWAKSRPVSIAIFGNCVTRICARPSWPITK